MIAANTMNIEPAIAKVGITIPLNVFLSGFFDSLLIMLTNKGIYMAYRVMIGISDVSKQKGPNHGSVRLAP